MKTALCLLLSAPANSGRAETVYKCGDNGKTVFTGTPTGPSCQPMGLQVIEADPQEAARQRRETELWNERRTEQVRQSLAREARTEQRKRKAELDAVSVVPRLRVVTRRGYGRRSRSVLATDTVTVTVPLPQDSSASNPPTGSAGSK